MAVQNPFYPVNSDLGALVTLTAASVGVASANQMTLGTVGVQVRLNVTALTGTTPTLTVTLQGYDPASGTYFTILASAAIAAVGMTVLNVFPSATAVANGSVNAQMPQQWRILTAIAGTTPAVTATVSACTLI